MIINLKVKTLDARTHEFSVDNELTIQQFKQQVAEKTSITAENQRIIYQGRVLSDEKQLKEYDVDGKVLHVAERPPFFQRGTNATNNDEPMRSAHNLAGLPTRVNLRNAPYFRAALDGMLVGTMAIPVNNGPMAAAGNRPPINRFLNSSSFCINRITVAHHMISCANNIAAYLEDPDNGLENEPMDILQRGHWTMESTVVEVGVSSADVPRNNNIIDMVQDAVTAALSRNTAGRNYTVVQLPTVYTNEDGNQQQQQQQQQQQRDRQLQQHSHQPQQPQRAGNESSNSSGAAAGSDTSEETTAAAAVIIEDVIEIDDETADGGGTSHGEDDRSNSPQAANEGTGEAGATAAGEEDETHRAVFGSGLRRRTRTPVLAHVFQRYRAVEGRLAPFLDLYHEILQDDPSFQESDHEGRENTQRIFDRVSEALHYMSHAQHAISDLMLDLSQPAPRVLTCRPILVEQSGYIRSNNIFTPNVVATPLTEIIIPQVPATAFGTRDAASTAAPAAGGTRDAASTAAPAAGGTKDAASTAAPATGVTQGAASTAAPAAGGTQDAASTSATAAGGTQDAASTSAPAAGKATTNSAAAADQPEQISPQRQGVVDVGGEAISISVGTIQDNQEPATGIGAAAEATPGAAAEAQEGDEHLEQPAEGAEASRQRFRLYLPVPLAPPNPPAPLSRLIQTMLDASTDQDLNQGNRNGVTSSTATGEAAATTDAATASQRTEQETLGNDNLAEEVAEADAPAPALTGLDEPAVAAGNVADATDAQARQDVDEHVEQPAEGVEAPRPRFRLYMPVPLPTPNYQMHMTRMIQAVVNNATNDADLRLEFNVPDVMSINLPVPRRPTAADDSTGAAEGSSDAALSMTPAAVVAAAAAAAVNAAVNAVAGGAQPSPAGAAASTSTGTRSGDQRANTLPTTATQTRSTSRPQIQIGGNNNWTGRIAPAHIAFDRFLPCNSHHIREPERNNNNNNINNNRDSTLHGTVANTRWPRTNTMFRLAARDYNATRLLNRDGVRRGSTTRYNSGGPGGPGGPVDYGGSAGAGAAGGTAATGGGFVTSASAMAEAGTLIADRRRRRSLSRLMTAVVNSFAETNRRNRARIALDGRRAANGSGLANAARSTVTTTVPVPAAAEVAVNSVGSNAPASAFASVVSSAPASDPASAPASASASAPASASASESASASADAGAASPSDVATASASASGASASASETAAGDAREASNVRAQLRGFLHRTFFEGVPINADTTSQAISRAVQWFSEILYSVHLCERREFNSLDSVLNAMRPSMHRIIKLCYGNTCSTHFEYHLEQILHQFRKRLYNVLLVCLGRVAAGSYWQYLMEKLTCALHYSSFRHEALQFFTIFTDPTLPGQDIADAQQFLVLRNTPRSRRVEGADTQQPAQDEEPQLPEQQQTEPDSELQLPQLEPAVQTLDNDFEMVGVASRRSITSTTTTTTTTEVEPPLPAVDLGSEPWHYSFPNDWLPVITRDLQTQSEQNRPQPPYSDAYISGMSAKRRKIIQSEKPATVEGMIASGVQRALQSNGLTMAANGGGTAVGAGAAVADVTANGNVNPDVVVNAIARDAVVQASYIEAVRTNARERIKQDTDYSPSKYPQIAKFTEQK